MSRNSDRQYSLIYNGQLKSTHPSALDAVRYGREIQKSDYKSSGDAKYFTVHHEKNGLQHEEDGYNRNTD